MKVQKPVTGSLIEKGGYYHTVINARVDGKRKQISRTTGLKIRNNYRRAQQIFEERKREYDQNGLAGMLVMEERNAAQNTLLSDYMEKWVERKKNEVAHATYLSYSGMIKSRIKRFFDPIGVTIGSATPQIFDDFIEELQDVGLNGSSQQRYYAAIKQCLDTAVRKDYILRNPLDRVDRPKRNKFYPSFCNEAEAKKILECAKDDPCYFPILLAVYYGLRRSEAIGLKWSSIDFENNQLHINHKAYEQTIKGKNVVTISNELKSDNSRRTIPLVPFVREELLRHREQHKEYKKAFRRQYNRQWEDFVCVNPKGDILRPNYVTTHFPKFLEKNGLRRMRFHDLRHSCASFLVAQGVNMKTVQLWMGHANFQITADTYSHLETSALQAPATTISDLLAEKMVSDV